MNGYPLHLVDSWIKLFLNRQHSINHVTNRYDVPKKEFLLVLPFLGSVSLKARTRLTKLFRKSLHCCNLQIIVKSPCSSLFCFKDKLPKHLLSGVVYKFTCSSCNATYIGKSLRYLKVRASEGLSVSHLIGKRVVSHQKSAISDHILEHDDPASFDDFSTLTSCDHG